MCLQGNTGGNPAARSVALQQAEKVLADYAGNRAGAPETKEALETILRVYQVRVQSEEMMEHPGPPDGGEKRYGASG